MCSVILRVSGDLVNVKESGKDSEALSEMLRTNLKMQFEILPYQSLSWQVIGQPEKCWRLKHDK